MQAHVKMRHIKIDIEGKIPPELITLLKRHYGKKVELIPDADDELVDIFETDWYKEISNKTTAGDTLRIYRKMHKITQEELGKKLGGISRQNVSHMERGTRPISLNVAKKLSKLFNISVERFINMD